MTIRKLPCYPILLSIGSICGDTKSEQFTISTTPYAVNRQRLNISHGQFPVTRHLSGMLADDWLHNDA